MEIIFKLCGAVLVALVLMILLERGEKFVAVLLCVTLCCIILTASIDFLQPILKLLRQLQRTAALDSTLMSILMKSVAIAIICEITAMVCTESGYSSVGKVLQYAGMTMILYLTIPLFSTLLEIIAELLSGL